MAGKANQPVSRPRMGPFCSSDINMNLQRENKRLEFTPLKVIVRSTPTNTLETIILDDSSVCEALCVQGEDPCMEDVDVLDFNCVALSLILQVPG